MSSLRRPFKLFSKPFPSELTKLNTALVVSDPQKLTMSKTGYFARLAQKKGVERELEYYFDSLVTVVKNIIKLLAFFRKTGSNIVFTRFYWDNNFRNGKSRRLSYFNSEEIHAEDFSFIQELKPEEEEIVLNKCCENPFNCTNIENILNNLRVKNIVICGVRTPGYLNTLAFDAADQGYKVFIVSDACTGGVRNGTSDLISDQIRVRNTNAMIEELTLETIKS